MKLNELLKELRDIYDQGIKDIHFVNNQGDQLHYLESELRENNEPIETTFSIDRDNDLDETPKSLILILS